MYLFISILNMYYHQIVAKLPNLSVLAIGSHLRKIMYMHSRCKTHVQESELYRILLRPLQETRLCPALHLYYLYTCKVKGKKHQGLGFLAFFLTHLQISIQFYLVISQPN